MLAGPSVAGILSIALTQGRAGFPQLWSRLIRWRVSARWYAVALLAAPILTTLVLLSLSLISPDFVPGELAWAGTLWAVMAIVALLGSRLVPRQRVVRREAGAVTARSPAARG